MFIYVARIASNELFSKFFNYKLLWLFLLILIIIRIISPKINSLTWMNNRFNYEINEINYNYIHFNNENIIQVRNLYNSHSFIIILLLINYLFFTLIVIVKITNIFYGPIRSNIF